MNPNHLKVSRFTSRLNLFLLKTANNHSDYLLTFDIQSIINVNFEIKDTNVILQMMYLLLHCIVYDKHDGNH